MQHCTGGLWSHDMEANEMSSIYLYKIEVKKSNKNRFVLLGLTIKGKVCLMEELIMVIRVSVRYHKLNGGLP